MRRLLVVASVAVSLLLLLSLGASYTGLFHLELPEERKDFGGWEMVGKLEVREGEESRLAADHVP